MDINLSNGSGVPIYEQIANQMKKMILSGQLTEGDALPSMRLLAKELRISVITTKRAYEDLERDGFISSVPGKGTYVAGPDMEFIREEHLRRIEGLLQEAIGLSRQAGIGNEELKEMLGIIINGENYD